MSAKWRTSCQSVVFLWRFIYSFLLSRRRAFSCCQTLVAVLYLFPLFLSLPFFLLSGASYCSLFYFFYLSRYVALSHIVQHHLCCCLFFHKFLRQLFLYVEDYLVALNMFSFTSGSVKENCLSHPFRQTL